MDTQEKAKQIGEEIVATGQTNKGRWMLAVMFVAGFVCGFLAPRAW
jgi:hypothetical protein